MPLFILLSIALFPSKAQQFDVFFADSTLRLDYIFAGDTKQVNIFPEELNMLDGWSGRRHNLDKLPLEGNGQIVVRDQKSGAVIYKTSFSSLFQEWLSTDEAGVTQRSYENIFLVPYPKIPVNVSITLENMHRKIIAHHEMNIDPKDILIHQRSDSHVIPHEYLVKSGSPSSCIDVVIMAEGYTSKEMSTFMIDARKACDALFSHEPFKSNKSHFNVIAVKSPSEDSGVSVPRDHTWKNTPYGSHFDTFYSARYLTSRRVKAIHNALSGIPYEHIIILANTDVYGGGGIYNAFTLTTSHNKMFEPVVVHEFGHSFGGLADEYFYDNDTMTDSYSRTTEPWEQNVTNLVAFKGEKWSGLIRKGTPTPTPVDLKDKVLAGLYEGAAYSMKGFYRCSYDCRMRTNEAPGFCPACRLALENLIKFYCQ
ncbi:M64 family metallopeptidase [Porphyromonas pogonae]|uniref:M64 family metallopeptidase n=1 Tax=Porphyromonas pogonae TaxID=867595 RepID=UPI002E78066A|nr:M64 family metallopeptidase [Porphyromonas pogonae]